MHTKYGSSTRSSAIFCPTSHAEVRARWQAAHACRRPSENLPWTLCGAKFRGLFRSSSSCHDPLPKHETSWEVVIPLYVACASHEMIAAHCNCGVTFKGFSRRHRRGRMGAFPALLGPSSQASLPLCRGTRRTARRTRILCARSSCVAIRNHNPPQPTGNILVTVLPRRPMPSLPLTFVEARRALRPGRIAYTSVRGASPDCARRDAGVCWPIRSAWGLLIVFGGANFGGHRLPDVLAPFFPDHVQTSSRAPSRLCLHADFGGRLLLQQDAGSRVPLNCLPALTRQGQPTRAVPARRSMSRLPTALRTRSCSRGGRPARCRRQPPRH